MLDDKGLQRATVLFTDIKGSSKLWEKNPEGMWKALNQHWEQVEQLIHRHKGFLVKSVGDAFMVLFSEEEEAEEEEDEKEEEMGVPLSVLRTLQFALDLQQQLYEESSIQVPDQSPSAPRLPLLVRIGFAFGPVFSRLTHIQHGVAVWDFFGPTVNTASRMESKVSPTGGFALAVLLSEKQQQLQWLDSVVDQIPTDRYALCLKNYQSDLQQCIAPHPQVLGRGGRRSSLSFLGTKRRVTFRCANVEELHGVGSVLVLKATPTKGQVEDC